MTVSVLPGNGDGTFQNHIDYPTGVGPNSVVVGDFNGDGKLDLATANAGDNTLSILLQPSPEATLSPTSLSFSDQLVGTTSAPQAVTVTNTGNLPLTITSLTGSGDFAQTNTCGSSVAAGASCTISVTFAPTVPGTRTGAITITDDAPGGPHIVSLTGTGTAPAVRLSATSLTFTGQLVTTTSAAQTVTLTNTGNAALAITSLAAGGDFAQTNTCGVSVAAGATCTISVTFVPTASGTRTGTITIKDNAAGSPQVVPLTGVGTAVSLSPTSLTFPGQSVGTTTSQNVKVTNHGSSPLSIISPATTGDFTASKLCGSSINRGGFCLINVAFKPSQTGLHTGVLTITDSDPGSPQMVALTGTGTAPAVGLSVASLSFAGQLVGTSSTSQSVTLTNTGDGPLAISSITATGDFTSTPGQCAGTVAAGKSCEITVVFKPQAGGSRTGSLSITDDASGSPQTVALTGTGQDFTVSASTTSVTVTAGQTASYTLSLASEGGFSGAVSLTCTGALTTPTCSLTPSSVTLAESGTTAVTVRVATARRGLLWASLAATLLLVVLWAGCGTGGGTPGPPLGTQAGTYPFTVTASGSGLTKSVSLTLFVN